MCKNSFCTKHKTGSGKKVRRREDLLNIEVSGLGRIRQRDPGVGFSLLVQEILQDGFGIDPDEFFPQDAIQQLHVAGVDAVAVVHHGEVTETFGIQTMDRPHHMGGIHRVNQVCDDAVHLLPHVDLPFVILLVDQNRVIRCSETYSFRYAVFMKDDKPDGADPHHASILPRDDVGHFLKPFHNAARLHRDFGNALDQ